MREGFLGSLSRSPIQVESPISEDLVGLAELGRAIDDLAMHVLRGADDRVTSAREALLTHDRAVSLVEKQRAFARGRNQVRDVAITSGRRPPNVPLGEDAVREETRE